jgi:hypothetical protein
MNHKKAMPANGTRYDECATAPELVLSQVPSSSGLARTESRINKRPEIMRTENTIPAIAASSISKEPSLLSDSLSCSSEGYSEQLLYSTRNIF